MTVYAECGVLNVYSYMYNQQKIRQLDLLGRKVAQAVGS